MNEKIKVTIAAVCGVSFACGIILVRQRPTSVPQAVLPAIGENDPNSNAAPMAMPVLPPQSAVAPQHASPISSVNPPSRRFQNADVAANSPATPKPAKKKKIQSGGQQQPDRILAAPEARVALSLVGTDNADAEKVWTRAINDPTVPPDERKDLIEDLNEDGFADPHHISPDEMTLVMSRIKLIEQLAPSAMDDVNAAAFKEAYKDLTNMLGDPNPK